jgi:hypothetical protein
MRRLMFLLIGLMVFSSLCLFAQENEKKFGISFSGFVKNDFFFDSRQTVSAREGHFLLWPSAQSLDAEGVDTNARSNFNFLAVQSRLKGTITGPDAFGAKTSGVIEGDFFAQANDNINLFRMRHAFIKLQWTNTELLTGQYWNPLFVTDCFPGTVSFNTGTPLQSFARNPQVRLTQSIGPLKIIGALLAQRDYTSRGPNGVSSEYLRNATIPDLHIQVHYSTKNDEAGTSFTGGAGISYKVIVPRLSSEIVISPAYDTVGAEGKIVHIKEVSEKHHVSEKVGGLTAIAFSKIVLKPVTVKIEGRYGENIADVLSISGFALKEVTDITTGENSYTPLKNITFWGELHTNGKKIQAGIFGGYLKNLGTKEEIIAAGDPVVYGLGTNIESLVRISPRIIFTSNKTKIAGEIEYTSAAYGSNYNSNYIPENTTTVSNVRLLISTIYSF